MMEHEEFRELALLGANDHQRTLADLEAALAAARHHQYWEATGYAVSALFHLRRLKKTVRRVQGLGLMLRITPPPQTPAS